MELAKRGRFKQCLMDVGKMDERLLLPRKVNNREPRAVATWLKWQEKQNLIDLLECDGHNWSNCLPRFRVCQGPLLYRNLLWALSKMDM